MGNQVLRCECGRQEGSPEQRMSCGRRSVLAHTLQAEQALQLGWGGGEAGFRQPRLGGFGQHSHYWAWSFIVWSVETGWEEGHRETHLPEKRPSDQFPWAAWVPLVLCFVPQKGALA